RKTRSRERGRGGVLQLRYTAASPSSPPESTIATVFHDTNAMSLAFSILEKLIELLGSKSSLIELRSKLHMKWMLKWWRILEATIARVRDESDELLYLKEEFTLLEPNKNGTIILENIKV
ncbi:hypothetical protein S245_008509, partial [Arachis hypogaea]